MRKVMIVVAAMAFLGFSQMPAATAVVPQEYQQEKTDDKNKNWTEIDQSELPEAVRSAFNETYQDYNITKVKKSDKEGDTGDQTMYKVVADRMGTEYYFKFNESGELQDSGTTAEKDKDRQEQSQY
jgi:hypothetical protein